MRLNKTPTPRGEFRVSNQLNGHGFGLGEEAEVPGENPHSHEENIQIPLRIEAELESNLKT